MTNEEAIKAIMYAKREVIADSWIDQAYDMAIKALNELPRMNNAGIGECDLSML